MSGLNPRYVLDSWQCGVLCCSMRCSVIFYGVQRSVMGLYGEGCEILVWIRYCYDDSFFPYVYNFVVGVAVIGDV